MDLAELKCRGIYTVAAQTLKLHVSGSLDLTVPFASSREFALYLLHLEYCPVLHHFGVPLLPMYSSAFPVLKLNLFLACANWVYNQALYQAKFFV